MTAPKQTMEFAAIPPRAKRDERLTALHLRVLIAIAGHDRLRYSRKRGNGQGCWASRETLAQEVGCYSTSVSHIIADLIKWKYLGQSRQLEDKRKQVLWVLYEEIGSEGDYLSRGKIGVQQNTYRQIGVQQNTNQTSDRCSKTARKVFSAAAKSFKITGKIATKHSKHIKKEGNNGIREADCAEALGEERGRATKEGKEVRPRTNDEARDLIQGIAHQYRGPAVMRFSDKQAARNLLYDIYLDVGVAAELRHEAPQAGEQDRRGPG